MGLVETHQFFGDNIGDTEDFLGDNVDDTEDFCTSF